MLRLASLFVVIAIAVLAATAVAATPPSDNLLQNPDAEAGATGHGNLVGVPGWTLTGSFTVDDYGDTDRLSKDDATKVGGGSNYFFGGPGKPVSTATQTVNLVPYADEIDKSALDIFFGGYLGGYASQADVMDISAVVLNATGGVLTTLTLHGPTTQNRAGKTGLQGRTFLQALPAGARSIRVTMTATRQEGSNNDGYADNVSLFLRERAPGPTAQILSALRTDLAAQLLVQLQARDAAAALALVNPSVAIKILSDACDEAGGCGTNGGPTAIVALLAPKVAIKILSYSPVDGAKIVAPLAPSVAIKILRLQPADGAKIAALLAPKVAARILRYQPADGAKILAKMPFASALKIMRLEPIAGARKALLNAMPKALSLHMRAALKH